MLVVHPTGACLDSQGVKCTAAPGVHGYDAGKKANGRKRHILVDTLGVLLAVVVTTASVQDRDGARLLLGRLPGGCTELREIWVEGGYAGQRVDWVAERFAFCLVVVLNPQGAPRVRSAAPPLGGRVRYWLAQPPPPPKQKLRLTYMDESWVDLAMTRIMLERLV